jgi:hypothetical protein
MRPPPQQRSAASVVVGSPIAHPVRIDLAFKGDRAARQHRGEQRNSTIAHFALPRSVDARFKKTAVAFEHIGAATCARRLHIVGLHETIEGPLKGIGRKVRSEAHLAPHVFQGPVLLVGETAPACPP